MSGTAHVYRARVYLQVSSRVPETPGLTDQQESVRPSRFLSWISLILVILKKMTG